MLTFSNSETVFALRVSITMFMIALIFAVLNNWTSLVYFSVLRYVSYRNSLFEEEEEKYNFL